MKRSLHIFIVTTLLLPVSNLKVFSQSSGEETFKQTCAACHTIGNGKLVGPDLINVQQRHSEKWMKDFIKSSQSVIKSGDKYADSLFKAFNQVQMPDHPNLSDEQLNGILAYIQTTSNAPKTVTASAALPVGNADRGRDLFVGNIRFLNHGASCNSCHNVDMKGFISGGALGKDLTHAVTRLTAPGVAGVVSGLPFPQMRETYSSRPVTPQEIADLTAFLTLADKEATMKTTNHVGNYLLIGGVSGIVIVLLLYSVFWIKRKKRPVNFTVFKRQIKSA